MKILSIVLLVFLSTQVYSKINIQSVRWDVSKDCPSDGTVDIKINVQSDTDVIKYESSIQSCGGVVTSPEGSVRCPHAAPYPGSAKVKNRAGETDEVSFQVRPCESGVFSAERGNLILKVISAPVVGNGQS